MVIRRKPDSPPSDLANRDRTVCRQIDQLQQLSEEERSRNLGSAWFDELRDFYQLTGYSTVASPSFRPRIVLPELQILSLAEATDISESVPKVYITHRKKRDEDREKAYQRHWRERQNNMAIFVAQVWSMFCGTSFLQIGIDPLARNGKGDVWLMPRDPSTCYPDPGVLSDDDWTYFIYEDKMYLDAIVRQYPDTGMRLFRQAHGVVRTDIGEPSHPGGLQMPEGPLRYGSGGPPQKTLSGDGRLIVRHCFILDYSRRDLSEQEKITLKDRLGPLVPVPSKVPSYPNGRWITDCEGVVLADGDFYLPFRKFPIVPLHSMPTMHSFWVPPPIRYTKALQELSERLLTGVFENAVRLNNGTWFIDEKTGITADDFGGIPAEVRVIQADSRVPECKFPPPFPEHFTQLPELLLAKQRAIQGFTAMRQGMPQAGNIAQSLFDASVFQAQVLTRMRAKLLAPAMQKVAERVFYAMCIAYRSGATFPGFGESGLEMTEWSPTATGLNEYEVFLDPSSIRPLSSSALRSLILALLEKGQLPLKYALEQLDFPHADEVAEEQRQQLELAAIAKTRRPR